MDEKLQEMKVEAPVLSFDTVTAEPAPVEMTLTQPQAQPKQEIVLTPEEQQQVDSFVSQIDLRNTQAIMNYGTGTQKKIADFSQKALDNVRTSDLGDTGKMISSLVVQLKNFDIEDEEKGLAAVFKKKKNKAQMLKAQYSQIETNVTEIKNELEKRQVQLMKDSALMDRMYEMNLSYFKELTMYILAGKEKLRLTRETELREMQEKAAASGLAEDAQAARDLADLCDRFEKKLYDLEVTRTIALQTGPQIRMVQASNTVMAEKIQSTIVNTIPLWKNQLVIAMGVEHSLQAAKAQREVSDMTNQLLKKNADALKMATVESVKESERGIVDMETLRHTNEALISTLDEVMAIQEDGRAKRLAAEQELADIENQLRDKMLQLARKQPGSATS